MAIALTNRATPANGGTGNAVLTLGWTPAVNELVVMMVGWNNNNASSSYGLPSGFTEILSQQDNGRASQRAAYRYWQSGDSTTLTCALTGANAEWVIFAGGWTGLDGNTYVESSVNSGTSTTPDSGSVATASDADRLWLGFLTNANFDTQATPTNSYTLTAAHNGPSAGASHISGGFCDKIVAAPGGTANVSTTIGNSRAWIGKGATFKAASAGGAPTVRHRLLLGVD